MLNRALVTFKPIPQFTARNKPASSVVTITLSPVLYHDRSSSLPPLRAPSYGSQCSVETVHINGIWFKNSHDNKINVFPSPK
jgi:hypothetical protein